MEKKPYIRPAIEIIEIDRKEMLVDLKVSGKVGHEVKDWDADEHDFDLDEEDDFQWDI